jgi:hypothetical protein
VLTILVDRRRSFWSGRLGEALNPFNLHTQDALRQSAAALHAAGFPQAQAEAGAMGVLHGRLIIQSVVNAFVDTYRYQTVLGVSAVLIALLFARGRSLKAASRWVVNMVR